jgi:hypothetical protein
VPAVAKAAELSFLFFTSYSEPAALHPKNVTVAVLEPAPLQNDFYCFGFSWSIVVCAYVGKPLLHKAVARRMQNFHS